MQLIGLLNACTMDESLRRTLCDEINVEATKVLMAHITHQTGVPVMPQVEPSSEEMNTIGFGANFGLTYAEMFILLHEFSHIDAGHLHTSRTDHAVVEHLTVISEESNQDKAIEYEADEMALQHIRPEPMAFFLMSVWTVLSVLAHVEVSTNAQAYPVATVVCVRAKGMKEPWCLAASTADEPARALIKLYARRWEIEGGFRDTKDLRFGMGLGSMHVSTPDRRDRLWLINAFAVVLLTLLGAAGEQLGYDRHLKTNTSKRRTHSLFRQGSMLYELMPNMTDFLLLPLIKRFAQMLAAQPLFAQMFGAI